MRIIPHLPPKAVTNFFRPKNGDGKVENFIAQAIRVGIAAGICFAAYKGSLVAAGLLATLSLPATTIAAGAMLAKVGYTAFKIGYISHQLKSLALGVAALYAAWQAFDNPYITSSVIDMRRICHTGFIEVIQNSFNITSFSRTIARSIGY